MMHATLVRRTIGRLRSAFQPDYEMEYIEKVLKVKLISCTKCYAVIKFYNH